MKKERYVRFYLKMFGWFGIIFLVGVACNALGFLPNVQLSQKQEVALTPSPTSSDELIPEYVYGNKKVTSEYKTEMINGYESGYFQVYLLNTKTNTRKNLGRISELFTDGAYPRIKGEGRVARFGAGYSDAGASQNFEYAVDLTTETVVKISKIFGFSWEEDWVEVNNHAITISDDTGCKEQKASLSGINVDGKRQFTFPKPIVVPCGESIDGFEGPGWVLNSEGTMISDDLSHVIFGIDMFTYIPYYIEDLDKAESVTYIFKYNIATGAITQISP